jgi:hypothetical protein
MHVEFSLEAKAEFEDSERYYECQMQGLGVQFCIALPCGYFCRMYYVENIVDALLVSK